MTDPIREFQTRHHNHLGKPLRVDGVAGPQTQWATTFQSINLMRQGIVRRAQRHIGLTENPIGSNRDPEGLIETWLEDCNAMPGQPWCASFVSFCLGFVRIAGAQALGKHFPATDEPYPGDVMWYPTKGWQGHCGVVIGADATEVMTIEGNLDNALRCARRPRAGLRFARVMADVTGTCPGVVRDKTVPLVTGGGTR